MGWSCRSVRSEEAWDCIEGSCPEPNMGLQEPRNADLVSMQCVKRADTMLSGGPGIARGVNLFGQTLRTCVNGLLVREAQVGEETTWSPHGMIADIARHIRLWPGEAIPLGTTRLSRGTAPGPTVAGVIVGVGGVAGALVAVDASRASAPGVDHRPADGAGVRRIMMGFDERVPDHFKQRKAIVVS
jgi:5-oxopent-3-ene-1,2,5-tricarboxylate decarboxylase/2-hydroxyhepta-2,4-diene-1,7-dioate isomerase